MPKAITIEQRIEEHIATASREELSSLIRAATLVIRAKYTETTPAPAVKRRGPGKPKPNGAEKESAERRDKEFASTI